MGLAVSGSSFQSPSQNVTNDMKFTASVRAISKWTYIGFFMTLEDEKVVSCTRTFVVCQMLSSTMKNSFSFHQHPKYCSLRTNKLNMKLSFSSPDWFYAKVSLGEKYLSLKRPTLQAVQVRVWKT